MNSGSGMIAYFVEQIPFIMEGVDTVISLIGIGLMAYSVFLFIVSADKNRRDKLIVKGQKSYLLVPVMTLLVGTMMWNRYLTASMMLSTFYGDGMTPNTLLDYPGGGINQEFDNLIKMISLVLRLFGYYVFFFKGWLTLRKAGTEDYFKEGMASIVFGTFLINNVQTVNGLSILFGFGSLI